VALAIGAAFMAIAALMFVSVPHLILRVFTSDVEVVATGVTLLLVAAVFQLFDGLQGVATGVLRGLGDTRTAMLSCLAGHWGIGLPVGYALCFWWGFGVVGLWIGLSTGLILVGIVLVPVWHRRVKALYPKA
jgi:MATE family multidrug resistance protein